ncbi:MAG TPA: superoxide dismutase family protein [Gemmatimonadaceae bacterium]|jgi:Cu-Zn family superoxide dismutase|nr:superoxide dismutase family protein [Gemmatimonadaceae bacterium]
MKVPSRSLVFNIAITAAVCGACSSAQVKNSVSSANAIMYNAGGSPVGTAQIWQDKSGLVHVDIASLSLPAGTHGIHFHEVGKCDGSTSTPFSTAGAHYNPMGKEHGLQNPNGPHAGDNPNIDIPASGIGKVAFSTNRVSLTPGTGSLFDADGSSLVIHAAADDQITNPSGNSGARIACGIVRALP